MERKSRKSIALMWMVSTLHNWVRKCEVTEVFFLTFEVKIINLYWFQSFWVKGKKSEPHF